MPPRHALAVAALLCLTATAASAQTLPSLDVRTWRPSTDPSASLVLEPAATPGPWNWSVDDWLSYTNRPVTITQNGGGAVFHPVQNLLANDLTASLGLGTRAALGLDLPMFLYQEGSTNLPASAVTSTRVPPTGLGDLALTGKGAIFTNDDGGFGLAVLGAVTVPTGDRESFMSQGSATVTARALADYSHVFGSLQASLGYTLLTQHQEWLGLKFGDQIPWSIGILLHPGFVHVLDRDDRQSWEVALHGSLPAGPVGPFGSGDPGSAALSPALLAFSDRIALGHFRDTYVLLGADVGLTNAVGVPTVRAIASIGWAPRGHDKDHDGVPDDVDQCPDIPEDIDGFEDSDGCPDLDNDDDGILDKDDACPNVKGVKDPDPAKNGCPRAPAAPVSDRDHDGIPDNLDQCPDQPEDRDGFQDADGCPDPDNDGDGIPDSVDACPDVPGEPSTDPRRNGCPNPDHDGDTFDDDVDKCPMEAEVFNGIKDDDGCPDEGGALLVTVDTKDPRLPVRLRVPIKFTGAPDPVAVDAASTPTLRALAQLLNRHRDWTLAVGVRPGGAVTPDMAMARSAGIAHELARLAHRDSAAETVVWESVAKQPGGESGVAFLVLVGVEGPVKPLRLQAVPAPVPGAVP
jgi:OOP family OmpA-OmpF porin